MPRRVVAFAISVCCCLILCAAGCNRKPKVPVGTAGPDVYDVDYEMKQLDSKATEVRLSAMLWLQKCDKGDAQKAIPKLQQIASGDKNPSVRKVAADTIKKIQGG